MVSWLSPFRLRATAVAAVLGVLLSGCAGGGSAYDSSLSPAQNQLRQSNARFNQTVAEGAGTGALVGGLAGLALGGRNRGQAMLIGATAGGALGAGAGYAVAHNNLSRSSTEAQFKDAIQRASSDAEGFRSQARISGQVADEAIADARKLNGQLRAGQITQAQYRAGTAKYQADSDAMMKQISEAQGSITSIRHDAQFASGSNSGLLQRSAADVETSRVQIQQNKARLSRAMEGDA